MIYAINKQTKEHVAHPDKRMSEVIDGVVIAEDGWELVEADAAGWIPCKGQESPVPDGVMCDTRDSYSSIAIENRDPSEVNWLLVGLYRPILDAYSKPEASAWDGEGLPPVGCECELLRGKEWVPVEITGKGKRVTVFRRLCNYGLEEITEADATEFRPIRTAAQRAEKAMVGVAVSQNLLMSPDCAKAIYSAIRDGKIPGVKLNDPKKENDQ